MNIVIVGHQHRDSEDDYKQVAELLDLLEQHYGAFTVLTIMCHVGIGRIVKKVCFEPARGRKHRFPLVEADVKVYAERLNKVEMLSLYTARNSMLFEAGDLFFAFPHPQQRAVIDELIEKRVIPAKRPYRIFQPGDEVTIEML